MATTAKDCKPPKGKSANRIYKQNTLKPWWKQGYLMVGADQLIGPLRAKHSQSGYIKKLAMPKAVGTSLINLLTTNKSLHSFFNGTSLDYSQLVPHIKLFKVYIHNDASTKKDLEEHAFPFGAFSNFHDFHEAAIASGKLFRGREAGIQQVDIKMEGRGRNPVSANILDITVKYFFNDVQTLFEPLGKRQDGKQMQFADLIRFPKSLRKTKRSFRIRLVLGWAMNPENPLKGDMPDGFVEAVRKSRVSIAADLYTHNMEFHEDGSLVLTAKYKGALEATFSGADILMAAVAADEKDKTLDGLKKKIHELEDGFAGSGFTSKGDKGSFKNILEIQKAIEELKKARLSIGARQNATGTYPKVKEALKKLTAAYKKYNTAPGRQGKSQFEALKEATRTKGSILERSEIERENARKVAMARKALEKRASKKLLKKLRKEIRKVRKQIKEYENSIKGKHIFSYVEKLRDDCKLAWISTGRGSNFGNYANLLDTVKKFGGSHDAKDQKKLQRAQKKVKVPVASVASVAAEDAAHRDPMAPTSHAAALLSTLYSRLAPFLEPLTPKEKAKDMLLPGANKGGCSAKGSKQRQRTEHGDATLWETVGTPAYKKGEKMYFFRLGDLLTVILESGNFGKRLAEDAPNFKVLLGEYDIPREDETVTRMSLYDLPISLEIFHIFVAQKIVGTGRAVYPLLRFTFDLIKFIMDKTQGVFGKAAEFTQASLLPVSFKMDITSVDLPSEPLKKAGDTIKLRAFNDKSVDKTSLNTLQTTSIANTSNTFVLHAQRKIAAQGGSVYNGNMAQDLERGIFHFFVGGPRRGVLKTINFTQAGNTLFSTALMRNGQAGGAESSREGVIQPSKFVCELKLVGNPFFFIGQMFYVNTDLISGGHFWQQRILNGGYYIVTAVDNNFRADSWETKIRGILQIPDHVLKKNKTKTGAVDKLKDKSLAEQERLKKQAQKSKPDVHSQVSAHTRRLAGITSKYFLEGEKCYKYDKTKLKNVRVSTGRCKD